MSQTHGTPINSDEAAEASDLEQKTGHGGNLLDVGTTPVPPVRGFADVVGSSGHVPRRDETIPLGDDDQTGSPGADADRDAGLP